MSRKENWIVTVCFFLVLAGFGTLTAVMPDAEVSKAERRNYKKAPKLTWETAADGSYMSEIEEYLLDQFVGRDWFRTLKTEVETQLFGKTDANRYVSYDGGLYELDIDWKKENVTRSAKEFAALQEQWFSDAEVYYALIPDKTYFLPKESFPAGEDEWVLNEMGKQLKDAVYIDLYPYLTIEDYYRTDLHWRQEAITDVADVLLAGMQSDFAIEDGMGSPYQTQEITTSFYGGYAGASAFETESDTLCGVTDEIIANAVVYDYEKKQEVSVYAPEKIDGMDPYDYYLWGARALLTIKNPMCENGKQLLLFRDSFGSSIAPLLIKGYEEITLVDLRYISADYLGEMIDMEAYEDVLFLYSQRVLRHSESLKF